MSDYEEKYLNDPVYHRVVQMITHLMIEHNLTVEDIRQASIKACINYEAEKRWPRQIPLSR